MFSIQRRGTFIIISLIELTIIYPIILSTSTLYITTFWTSITQSIIWNDSSLNASILRIIWIWSSSSSFVWWFSSSSSSHEIAQIKRNYEESLTQITKREIIIVVKGSELDNKKIQQEISSNNSIISIITDQFYRYQQQWQWSDLDEQRAANVAEVLQCNQEQAREYLMKFRDLTLDQIVMMVENAE
ncbi:unnamed protein product [Paramecium sonneborni]|uniref:Uncharacterized protein n=1 Tax=Paramecium sonneborni TaxID=65129 RepID=A0A8S1RV79_9CILI|nr:unnamed protein product [Paramecium sonneborni]